MLKQLSLPAFLMEQKFYRLICLSLAIVLGLSLAGCSNETATKKQDKLIKLTLQTAPAIVQFFNGVWLEWFVFVKMLHFLRERQLSFSGARSIIVTLPNEDYHELDTFFLIDNRIPICIECKTGEFRQDLDKYSKLRKRLSIDKSQFLLCVLGLSDEQAQGLTSMYEVTLVNENTFLPHVEQLLR